MKQQTAERVERRVVQTFWLFIGLVLVSTALAVLIHQLGWVLLWAALGVLVVGTAIRALWVKKVLRPLQLKERIARLEAANGVPVAMEGECGSCHMPLAAGAKWCAYCGVAADVNTILVLCPQCKTRAPFQAKYCPQCRTRLAPFPNLGNQ